MKKIYFLMLMLLMSVSGMWAQDWGNIGSLKVSPAMQDGEFVSGTVFYQIQNKKQGYLSTSSMSGDNLLFVNSGMSADGFRWAILGDAENGFQFVNKVTKTAIGMNKFEVTNQENQSLATTSYLTADLEDANTRFALAPHKYVTPYFIVTAQDNHYFYWNQLTTLGYWYSGEGYEYGYRGWKQNEAGTANSNKGDDGASFRFNEVETLTVVAEADYTVVIVGAPEGYTVSYNGAEYANGDVITGIIWNINLLTVNPIEGYKSEVSVENNTVTITFTRKPITSLEEVEAGRLYTLTSVNRGSFVYASAHEGYLSGSGLTKNEFDATSENFQFAFVENEGNTYLWSRGAGKFAAYGDPNVIVTDEVPSAGISLLASTGAEKAEYPTVLVIDGEHQINMSVDQEKGLLTNWNDTADKGNMLAIVATEATLTAEELAAIAALLNPAPSYTYTVTISGAPEESEAYITVNGEETHYASGAEITVSEELTAEDIEAAEIEGYTSDIDLDGVEYTITVTYTKKQGPEPTTFPAEGVAYKVKEVNGGNYVTIIDDDTQAVTLSTTAQEIYFEATTGGFFIKNAAGQYMTVQAKSWNIASVGDPIVWEVEKHDSYYALKNSEGYLGFNSTGEGVKGFRNKLINENAQFEIMEFSTHEQTLAEKLQALIEETNTLVATNPDVPKVLITYANIRVDEAEFYLEEENTTDERLEFCCIILQRNLDRINGYDATTTAAQWMEELTPVYEQAKKYIDDNKTDYEYNYETEDIDISSTLAGKVGYKPYDLLYYLVFDYDDINYYLENTTPEVAHEELEGYGYGLWYYAYMLQDDILDYERTECVLPAAGKNYVIRLAPDRYSYYLTANEEVDAVSFQEWSSSFVPNDYSTWTCTGMKAYNKINDELETEYIEDRLQFVNAYDPTKYLAWKTISNKASDFKTFWHISGKDAPLYGAMSMQAYDGSNHFKFLTIDAKSGAMNHADAGFWVEHSQYSSWFFFEEVLEAEGVGTVLAPTVLNSGNAIFNLQGQRLNEMKRGLNIVGGKKVFK